MRLIELKETKKPGTYAAVKFDKATVHTLQEFIKDQNIPNKITPKKMHCTLLFSTKNLPDYEPLGKLDPTLVGKPTTFEIWESQPDENNETANCLVLNFDCKELVDRHKKLMDDHKATFSFDEYKTHVTLSYDIGDMKIDDFPKGSEVIDKIVIDEEYGNDLDPNWAKGSTS